MPGLRPLLDFMSAVLNPEEAESAVIERFCLVDCRQASERKTEIL